ncbi:MAG: transcriptional regulator, AraC family [Sphingobacteriales bacterium]|nr:transcriptional regulator, AraC family [Sphingobacteriales bacterium]
MQQHVHNKLIEKAKERLSATNLSESEIAYELGFEYSQLFSKLFKTQTNLLLMELGSRLTKETSTANI